MDLKVISEVKLRGWVDGLAEQVGREMAELSLGKLLAWTTEWMVREPPELDIDLLFRLFLNIYTRMKVCAHDHEQKGHFPVGNTEGGTKFKMEMTSPF